MSELWSVIQILLQVIGVIFLFILTHKGINWYLDRSKKKPECSYKMVDWGVLGEHWICTVHGRQPRTLTPIGRGFHGPCMGAME